jgi:hypothetical protein
MFNKLPPTWEGLTVCSLTITIALGENVLPRKGCEQEADKGVKDGKFKRN